MCVFLFLCVLKYPLYPVVCFGRFEELKFDPTPPALLLAMLHPEIKNKQDLLDQVSRLRKWEGRVNHILRTAPQSKIVNT